MKISELKDKQPGVNITVKVIFDQTQEKEMWGRRVKSVVVADVDSTPDDNSPTAWLDLYDDDVDKYKQFDKIKVVNGYAKLINTNKGQQMLITYGFKNKQLVGHYEAI